MIWAESCLRKVRETSDAKVLLSISCVFQHPSPLSTFWLFQLCFSLWRTESLNRFQKVKMYVYLEVVSNFCYILKHRVHRVATATLWHKLLPDGKISPGWWGWGGGARSPFFTQSTITYKVARSSWEGRYIPPISLLLLYVLFVLKHRELFQKRFLIFSFYFITRLQTIPLSEFYSPVVVCIFV